MSVLIKGMEMPTEEYGTMTIKIYPNGHVAEYIGDMGRVWDAVPVPPHGRLIDADALHYNRIRIAHPDGAVGGWNAVVMSAEIKDAPTIIPADPGEEGET
jgi:hypothetical protein